MIKTATWMVRNVEKLRKAGEEVGGKEKHDGNGKWRIFPIWHSRKKSKRERKSLKLIKTQKLNRWHVQEEVHNDFPTCHTIKREMKGTQERKIHFIL